MQGVGCRVLGLGFWGFRFKRIITRTILTILSIKITIIIILILTIRIILIIIKRTTNERMNGCMDGCMDGWMDEWMDEKRKE